MEPGGSLAGGGGWPTQPPQPATHCASWDIHQNRGLFCVINSRPRGTKVAVAPTCGHDLTAEALERVVLRLILANHNLHLVGASALHGELVLRPILGGTAELSAAHTPHGVQTRRNHRHVA